MYKLCAEVVIPRTTTEERVAAVKDGDDLASLVAALASESDLTLTQPVKLASRGEHAPELTPGLCIHGRLEQDGTVRRRYWGLGAERSSWWPALGRHGRMQEQAETVPEGHAESEARLWNTSDICVGDVLVLRRGVSYAETCSQ